MNYLAFSRLICLYMNMSATLKELQKAFESLKTSKKLLHEAIDQNSTHIELHRALRDSCIQRFEFCVELSWKISMKVLGLSTQAPNPAIREMAQNGLIEDTQLWFNFLVARNKTSHSYDEGVAQEVYREIEKFIEAEELLIEKLSTFK
jgi:nucleotidyltransferase substrate binding protein (TIGR01987 family)